MLKKLDNLVFTGLHLCLLGFLLYGCLTYAPESPATIILGLVAVFVVGYFISAIIFKLNNLHINKKINRYYGIH